MTNTSTYDWVKKLGQWHLSEANNPTTICGVPMLGNNYASVIPESDRKPCDKCFPQKPVQSIEQLQDDSDIFLDLTGGAY
jgi:hypothetical protein